MTKPAAQPIAENAAKRFARLAAVQALYRLALSEETPAQVIRDFRDHPPPAPPEAEELAQAQMDHELFGRIVGGAAQESETLDGMIAGAFDAKLSAQRIEILLRAILRAGAWELHHNGKVPASIIINDYVDVAHAFFGQKEPGLVNAVLDKLGKNLRR